MDDVSVLTALHWLSQRAVAMLSSLARCLPASPTTSCDRLHSSALLPHASMLELDLQPPPAVLDLRSPHFAAQQNLLLISDV